MSEDNSSHPTDQATLMDVMDAQEAIEEAESHAEIEALMEANEARIKETTAKMAEAFERDDSEAAKNECVRLKYWRSLQDGLKDWEPGKEVRLIH
jgi:molecular chaperone HscB